MLGLRGRLRQVHAGFTLAILLTLTTATYAQAYCTSSGSNTNYEWINQVSLAGISKYSGSNGGYADYTSTVIDLTAGANSITLTPGFRSSTYTEYWKVWIDFNHDDTFTDDESVFSGASSSALSGAVTVPETATSGATRMRVSMRYGSTPQPCGSFTYGEVEDYTVNLNTTDVTSPTVSSTTPGAGAVDVAIDSTITVTFSETIDPVSVSDSSIALNDGGQYLPGTVSISGKVLTFTPSQPLQHTTQYTAVVYAGLLDLAGNPLLQDKSWSFTTAAPDVVAPTITQVSPQNGATDIDNNFVLQAMFSEAMDPATINASTFTVSDGVNNIPGSVVLVGNGKTAQFYPAQPYDYLTSYTVTVSSAVKDLAGNPMQADYSWSFTSREYQLAYCDSYANYYNYMWIAAVKVDNFTYSSPSQPATGYSDNTSKIFDLSRYFPRSIALTPGYSSYAYTTYWRVFIDWNQDGAFTTDEIAFSGSGNSTLNGSISVPESAVAGNTRMRISMQYATYPGACGPLSYGEVEDYRVYIPDPLADTTPPEVSTVSPLASAQNVSVGTTLTVSFSEAIDPATLSGTALTLSGGTLPVTLNVSYDAQTKQAVFTPAAALENDTFYTATLSNSVSDVAGNHLLNDYVWSFTTEPAAGPVYAVTGSVLTQGSSLADVTITVSGDAALTTMTDSNGNYSIAPLPPGNYTITPSKAGYTFTPANLGLTVVDGDVSAVDFTASVLNNVLINGDFEQGNFNGFNSFTTANGTMSKGIILFDTDNDGVTSLAAQFVVGTDSISSVGSQQGGGIYQTVGLGNGDLTVSMNIAASAGSNNGDGGTVSLYFDGVLMNSHSFGSITAGINEYATLSFNVPNVTAGNHELRIQFTRAYMPASISNYVDNIILTGTSTQ